MLRKRLTFNLVANVFLFLSNTLVQIGGLPLFLHFWSRERYGEWLILYSIPGYMALADAGISSIAANEATMHLTAGDSRAAQRSLHTAFALLSGMGAILLLLTVASTYLLPWSRILGIHSVTSRDCSRCIVILAVYTIAGMAHMYYLAVYRAKDRFSRCVYLIGCTRIAEVVVSAACLLLWNSFVLLAASITMTRLVTVLIMQIDTARGKGPLRAGIRMFSWSEVRRTWYLSLGAIALPAGSAFYYQGMTLLVGRILGPAQVVALNAVRIMTRSIPQIVAILKNSTVPEFSVLYGKVDMARVRKLNQLSFEVAALIAALCGSLLILAGPFIVTYWTRGALSIGRGMICLFLISAVINALGNISSGFLNGVNQHIRLAVLSCIMSIASLVLARILMPTLGLSAAAWAMIGCEGVLLSYAIWDSCRLLRQPVTRFLIEALTFRETIEVFITQKVSLRQILRAAK
jgi:O-antigen/teichoic acid export membrane protein